MRKLDKKTLALCRKWQKRLRLLDWDIEFRYAKPSELPHATDMGCVTLAVQHRDAKILLLAQSKRGKTDQRIEHTIVHELIHVMLEPLIVNCDFGKDGNILDEQVVNALSNALTKMRNPSLEIDNS